MMNGMNQMKQEMQGLKVTRWSSATPSSWQKMHQQLQEMKGQVCCSRNININAGMIDIKAIVK